MKTLLYLVIFICVLSYGAKAQYEIKVTINKMPDSEITLAYYYENKIYRQGVAKLDKSGTGYFKDNEKKLAKGIYLLFFSPEKYVDIIVGDNQHFQIECDTADLLNSIKATGDPENVAFIEFQRFLEKQNNKKIDILKSAAGSDKYISNIYQHEVKLDHSVLLDALDNDMRKYVIKLTLDFPGSALASFANFLLQPKIPDFAKQVPPNAPNREAEIHKLALDYAREHYWDYTNFTDTTLIRTPIFKQKLDYYFENLIVINADSLIKASNNILEKSQPSKGMFKYLMEYCMVNSIDNTILGMDKAFVRLGQKYYMSGIVDWHSEDEINKITYEIVKRQHNLIGQKAMELKLPHITQNMQVSLYETEAPFTLLMFWQADCEYCQQQIALSKKEIYDRFSPYGLKIFSVHTTGDKNAWENFVNRYDLYDYIHCWDPQQNSNYQTLYNIFSTPVFYVLDKNKRIIAKNLVVEQIVEFLRKEYKKINISIKS